MSAAQRLLAAARKRGLLLATAESCTGGMLAAAITDPPGASAIFDRGFVTYSNAAKVAMLGVADTRLETFGAVSEEVARDMAAGALEHSDAQLAVSITGIAGPGGSGAKPEGRVCFAVAMRHTPVRSEMVEFGALGREAIRCAATDHALALLADAVEGLDAPSPDA